MNSLYRTILAPVITEKATKISEKNQYVFKVRIDSNKKQIKEAVEKLFKVKEIYQAYMEYKNLLKYNGIDTKINLSSNKIDLFMKEINIDRLSNNPVNLNKNYIKYIFSQI